MQGFERGEPRRGVQNSFSVARGRGTGGGLGASDNLGWYALGTELQFYAKASSELMTVALLPVLSSVSALKESWGELLQFSRSFSCPTLCDPMDCSMPGLPVHHQLPEFTPTHVHWVADAIQPAHPLSSPSPPAFHLSQHQGLFKWVSSLHQVAKGVS